ncbi:MAG: hypothetical protein J3Q66DRAFT_368293 [Benniella sp.]|nr:MAG: hypothetical protein J3Q66DRAFT_368293 [Benniella sp.]
MVNNEGPGRSVDGEEVEQESVGAQEQREDYGTSLNVTRQVEVFYAPEGRQGCALSANNSQIRTASELGGMMRSSDLVGKEKDEWTKDGHCTSTRAFAEQVSMVQNPLSRTVLVPTPGMGWDLVVVCIFDPGSQAAAVASAVEVRIIVPTGAIRVGSRHEFFSYELVLKHDVVLAEVRCVEEYWHEMVSVNCHGWNEDRRRVDRYGSQESKGAEKDWECKVVKS